MNPNRSCPPCPAEYGWLAAPAGSLAAALGHLVVEKKKKTAAAAGKQKKQQKAAASSKMVESMKMAELTGE